MWLYFLDPKTNKYIDLILFNIAQQFEAILAEVKHYMSTVGDTSTILSLIDSLCGFSSSIFTQLKEGVLGNIQWNAVNSALLRAKAWYTSAERFVQQLKKEHPLYCDLLGPFVAGVSQVRGVWIF